MKKYHYVYRITNKITGKHYYGGRSSKRSPSEDLGHFYFSSYTNKYFKIDQKQNPSHYKYKVIKEFSTRKEANEFEIFLHKKFDVKNHPKFINKSNQTSKKFDTTGISVNKNKVTVVDLRDNTTKHISTNNYKNYDFYVSVNKGKKRTSNQIKQMSESRKGKKRTIESRRKQSKTMKGHKVSDETKKKIGLANSNKERPQELRERISKKLKGGKISEETKRKISESSKGKTISEETTKKRKLFYSKRFVIFDENGVIQYDKFFTKSDMMKFAEKENLPFNNFYKNIGKEIMVGNIDSGNLKRFEENGWFPKFKGWKMTVEETKK